MHINHQYLLNLGLDFARTHPGMTMLDYGCGNGEIVEEGLKRGLAIYGTDIFYEPNPETKAMLKAKKLFGDRIREIEHGTIPFAEEQFDLVTSNMVFEHVQEMEPVLAEINRVLKPGGILVTMFPTQEVWWEAHTGIPFVHWLKPGSVMRRNYTLTLRALGFGTFKTRPLSKWVDGMLTYLDTYVHYRPMATIERLMGRHFALDYMDGSHATYRLEGTRLRPFAKLMKLPFLVWLGTIGFRRVAYVVLVAKKPGGPENRPQPGWLPRKLTMMKEASALPLQA